MIDPPRAFKHESGFGHYDKFHFTVDKNKYPNFPFEIIGILRKKIGLELLFRFAIGSTMGQFSYENELINQLEFWDNQGRKDLIFTYYLTKNDNEYKCPGYISWRGRPLVEREEDLSKFKEKYPKSVFLFSKPVIINGLENIRIKWKEN